jgi:hypothetical protein
MEKKQTRAQTPGIISSLVINQQQTKCLHFSEVTVMNSFLLWAALGPK